MSQNVIEHLQKRGFIEAMTSEEIKKFAEKPLKVYCGFDPTAESLHLGNLVAIIGLAWFQKFGHQPVAVVGGATGLVGDPSGKSKERPLLDEKILQKNLEGIEKNLRQVLDFESAETKPLIRNNYEWFKKFGYIEFLRDVGKLFRMGPMLTKDSVRTRLDSDEGLSYTEFSYQCLQAYDFLHLFQEEGVECQLGGADQWGNITAGTELIRKVTGKSAQGVTFPLLTRSDGKKFGKSEGGAIWLSAEMKSPYEFYQYLFSIPDADVGKLLRMLTFIPLEEIEAIEEEMQQPGYAPNAAQKRLAAEVTTIVHGEEGLQKALKATEGAKPGSSTTLDAEMLESIASDMPSRTCSRAEIEGSLIDLLVLTGLASSKGEGRRSIRNGGAYLNNQKVSDEALLISEADLIEGRVLLLGIGKKKKMLVRLQEE